VPALTLTCASGDRHTQHTCNLTDGRSALSSLSRRLHEARCAIAETAALWLRESGPRVQDLITGAIGDAEGVRAAGKMVAGRTSGMIAARPAAAISAAICSAPAHIMRAKGARRRPCRIVARTYHICRWCKRLRRELSSFGRQHACARHNRNARCERRQAVCQVTCSTDHGRPLLDGDDGSPGWRRDRLRLNFDQLI
jgi:hypothetical protein